MSYGNSLGVSEMVPRDSACLDVERRVAILAIAELLLYITGDIGGHLV